MRIRLAVIALGLALAACGGKEGYPDLSEVPERPTPDLGPDRSEAMAEELRATRDEARRYADEGRRSTTGRTAADLASDSDRAGDTAPEDGAAEEEEDGAE